jgi:catechol 2,3-dioxygenase-like lactoylglutathione lyase family enzyme
MFGTTQKTLLGNSQAVATIPVRDEARAKAFYGETLGLALNEERPGAATFRSGTSVIFVYESDKAGTNKGTTATWPVQNIDSVVDELKKRGVAFERYDDLPGLVMRGDIHVGGDMKVAWFKDPDGNILSLVAEG